VKLAVVTPVRLALNTLEKETKLYVSRFLRQDTELCFVNVQEGLPCIESEAHALLNGPQTLALARQAERNGADGVFVNCFDDPTVYACRECMSIPVFGGYTPSILTALGLAERIGVITTDAPGILSEERKARLLGVSGRIGAIRCADMSVPGLMSKKEELLNALTKSCLEMYEKDHVGAVCLGCTGMAYAADDLCVRLDEYHCPVAVVEPVTAALTWLERTVIMKQSNSLGVKLEL
jgi:allantoin racemase